MKNIIGILLTSLLVTAMIISFSCEKTEPDDPNPGISGYPIVSTNQTLAYDTANTIILPSAAFPFFGQDANYTTAGPSYTDNGDGTVSDNVTGLMWQQDPGKMSFDDAIAGASSFNLAGYSDWRLPSIKELYSLIIFSGEDPSGFSGTSTASLTPFIDTNYFNFSYGDLSIGERIIDAQYASSTVYVGNSGFGGGSDLVFGVNFADGRIKGYPKGPQPGQTQDKQFFVLYVRGNAEYGINDFKDNGDATITDLATGLMWMQDDLPMLADWPLALSYAESHTFAGHSDWRLPDVKELQSIVDYVRSPDTDNSAAIDPLFNCVTDTNELGQADYACYWSSTTHANMQNGGNACYVSFGRAMGYFNGQWMDVHGAGAQRSDPKVGDPADWPTGHGPQGDAIRILNRLRLVRDVE